MGSPSRSYVRTHRVGGKEKDVSVSACTKQNSMAAMGFDLPGDQVSGDDASGFPINDHHIHHFSSWVHFNFTVGNLPAQGRIGA